jgi:hypothetical protein
MEIKAAGGELGECGWLMRGSGWLVGLLADDQIERRRNGGGRPRPTKTKFGEKGGRRSRTRKTAGID